MSTSISLEGADKHPSIFFDSANQLKISGFSVPENGWSVYESIIMKVSLLIDKTPDAMNSEFKLEYFNKTSFDCILDLFKLMLVMKKKGWQIKVKWFYQKFDEDMREAGETYSKILGSSIELIEFQEMILS